MDSRIQPITTKTVADTFAAWRTVKDKLAQVEEAHKYALKRHAEGVWSFPTELEGEVTTLREERDRLCLFAQHALLKRKAPRSSSDTGSDSTWS